MASYKAKWIKAGYIAGLEQGIKQGIAIGVSMAARAIQATPNFLWWLIKRKR